MISQTLYPRLINNEVVTIKGHRYRVGWWSNRTYEFTYVGDKGKFDFTKPEVEVVSAIKKGIIKRNNLFVKGENGKQIRVFG